MTWYTILFAITSVLFIVKMVLSFTAGDLDLDVDFDDIDDVDVSGAFSFKGLLHFLLGFSAYLFMRSNVYGFVQFSIFDYILAIIIGISLTILLFFGYRFAMKANNQSQNPKDLIDNCTGTIYINLGKEHSYNTGKYVVQAHTKAGTTEVVATHERNDLEPGTQVKLTRNNNEIFITLI